MMTPFFGEQYAFNVNPFANVIHVDTLHFHMLS